MQKKCDLVHIFLLKFICQAPFSVVLKFHANVKRVQIQRKRKEYEL